MTIKPYEDMSKDVYASAHAGETLWMDVDRVSIAMLEEAEASARRRAAPRQIGAFGRLRRRVFVRERVSR